MSKRNHMVSVCFVLFVKGEGDVQCALKTVDQITYPQFLFVTPRGGTAIEVLQWMKLSRHNDGSLASMVVCFSGSAGGFTTVCGERNYWLEDLLGDLRDKLAHGNVTDVAFMIVNEQDAQSRAMYWELKRRVAQGIPVYQQSPLQNDVWEILDGDKDDFFVYDRYEQNTL
ncbi:Selenoprotein P [Triplophysa rosa]|uniref:Selenoprotein P n=1 Tax=Triplophysa rosa TaxID=992332 RepID=A0A9W7WWG6_TRIRA|nr:Selenoprotein P [Triplophysa rosa]